jgi:hypothetical protein
MEGKGSIMDNLPLMKAEFEMMWLATGVNRVAYALETSLKIILISAMGQYCLIESAPGIFEISDRIPKFNREIPKPYLIVLLVNTV